MTGVVSTTLEWAVTGQRLFDTVVGALDDADFRRPSRLPQWTNAHVVAHVAANADALGNLVAWARTGIETPMYSSPQQRDTDIEQLAQQPVGELRALHAERGADLLRLMRELPETAWRAPVRTAQGREVEAAEVPWMRSREVFVHAADLVRGPEFDRFPADFVDALIDDIVARRNAQVAPDVPRVTLVIDGAREVSVPIAEDGVPTAASGAPAAVASYLAGRGRAGLRVSGDGLVPPLGPWL